MRATAPTTNGNLLRKPSHKLWYIPTVLLGLVMTCHAQVNIEGLQPIAEGATETLTEPSVSLSDQQLIESAAERQRKAEELTDLALQKALLEIQGIHAERLNALRSQWRIHLIVSGKGKAKSAVILKRTRNDIPRLLRVIYGERTVLEDGWIELIDIESQGIHIRLNIQNRETELFLGA